MIHLALFPLNTVLFPGMPINLHIFEPRYKQMLADCLEGQRPFGVVLERNSESPRPFADPYPVGCTAVVTHVQPLEDGRMNVVAVGDRRFQIHTLDYSLPYLVGAVEYLPQSESVAGHHHAVLRRLRPWVQRYLSTLASVEQVDFELPPLPEDPILFANLAAFVLQLPPSDKQELLTTTSLSSLLARLHVLYRRETTLLDAMVNHAAEVELPFSMN